MLNFAVVGCGRIGRRHAEKISKVGKLVGVCDVDRSKLNEFSRDFAVSGFFSIEELYASTNVPIDVLSICTPNGLHCEHTVEGLQRKSHVLCEKPMALSTADCAKMISVAKKVEKKLFIVKQNRFNPPIRALKKVISSGRLGQIFSMQLNCFWNRGDQYYENDLWKGTKKDDGGCLFTQFSHFIDLVLWLLGPVQRVEAFADNFNHSRLVEFEDTGVAILQFDNGALGTINFTINSFEKNMEGSISIFGERGTVKVGGEYLNVLEYQRIQDFSLEHEEVVSGANDYGYYQGSMSNHQDVYENVVRCLEEGEPIATSGEEGMNTVRLIEEIYKKVR